MRRLASLSHDRRFRGISPSQLVALAHCGLLGSIGDGSGSRFARRRPDGRFGSKPHRSALFSLNLVKTTNPPQIAAEPPWDFHTPLIACLRDGVRHSRSACAAIRKPLVWTAIDTGSRDRGGLLGRRSRPPRPATRSAASSTRPPGRPAGRRPGQREHAEVDGDLAAADRDAVRLGRGGASQGRGLGWGKQAALPLGRGGGTCCWQRGQQRHH